MGPTSAIVYFGTFLFFSFLVIRQEVASELTSKPLDSEALVNESTYFNCSSSIKDKEIQWIHYPVGIEAHQGKTVYAYDKFYTGYEEDFVLERNLSTGAYNIVIKSVKPRYAGRYECQDQVGLGNRSSAQLVVLDVNPTCSNPNEVIGSNPCGIQPEDLHLSCSISYHGIIPPELKWHKLGDNVPITENITKGQSASRVTYNLMVSADLLDDTSLYECETATKSRASKHSCTSDLKLLYIFNTSSVSAKSIDEEVNCSANTNSPSCEYKWQWYNKEDTRTVSNNRILVVEEAGMHRCEATCNLRNVQCTVNAILINATQNLAKPEAVSSNSVVIVVVVLVLLLVVIAAIGLLIFIRKRRQRSSKPKQYSLECPLLQNQGTTEMNAIVIPDSDEEHVKDANRKFEELEKAKDEEHPENIGYLKATQLHVEGFDCADNEKTVISGLTVLGKELFIAFEQNPEVMVYQAITFNSMRSFAPTGLDNPLDMVSSPMDSCLYISSPREIWRIDVNGMVISKWPTKDGGGTLSVTNERTVILVDYTETALREYSIDGILNCEVRLPADVHPFHAVKATNGTFVVSYDQKMVHKVARFDMSGTLIQSYSGMLKFPKYLAVNSDGNIFVADQRNSRVLLMSPTFGSAKVLLSEKDDLYRPSRVCLDEQNSRMFIADIKTDNLRFIAFKLQKWKTGASEDTSAVPDKLKSNHKLNEDSGSLKNTVLNQDKPLESSLNLKEGLVTNDDTPVNKDTNELPGSNHNLKDSGGMKDNSVVIPKIVDNEEEDDEFEDAPETLDNSQGGTEGVAVVIPDIPNNGGGGETSVESRGKKRRRSEETIES